MNEPSNRLQLGCDGANRGFADHFSAVAQGYATYRPGYPDELFGWLAAVTPAHRCTWDCATGTGQAAAGLANHFDRVVATDASLAQVRHAVVRRPNILFAVALAEVSCLASRSVGLVAVAQALHWFDVTAFFAQVQKVLQPSGILAVWCYRNPELDRPDLQERLDWFYTDVVGSY